MMAQENASIVRSVVGQSNDERYKMLRAGFQDELKGLNRLAAFRTLYEQQMDIGFIQDDLSLVRRFRCCGEVGEVTLTFIGQYNPRRAERSKGAGRKKSPTGIQVVNKSCFLCPENIYWQHRGLQLYYQFTENDRDYNALCNPFPFMPVHITVASKKHEPQSWRMSEVIKDKPHSIVKDLWDISVGLLDVERGKDKFEGFVGFYNGIGAGASIEHHFHYQFFEIPQGHGFFPLEEAAESSGENMKSGVVKIRDGFYPLTAVKLSGNEEDIVSTCAKLIKAWDKHLGEAASANIITISRNEQMAMYFVPPNSLYTRSPGLSGTVGVMETLGEFIFCEEWEDQIINEQKVDFHYLWRVLQSVHPPQCANFDWDEVWRQGGG